MSRIINFLFTSRNFRIYMDFLINFVKSLRILEFKIKFELHFYIIAYDYGLFMLIITLIFVWVN